ncbi:hypothetical protein GCM10008023_11710 [Sphingomonas glacialis]|uniref:DUF4350 domain-containing protein n=1 Tax=Sphingomonas glacialis TaxID=658225 RepID=A0ABQ3LEQ3_9SPHN|nr:hypothetical protein [Sphingomonas glacialis]GHH12013.1 hypothetical protein GCM10008023_11710 [Sphingomonas glacialis]
MSDVTVSGASGANAFSVRTVAILLAVGIFAFIAMLVLGAYAPDLRSGRDGRAHALSNAAVGYSGIVRLAEATGRNPQIVRNPRQLAGEDLVVLTPETGATDMTKALAARGAKPTLVILPKWRTSVDPTHSGWARFVDFRDVDDVERVLAPQYMLKVTRYASGGRPLRALSWMPRSIAFAAPRPVQTITGLDVRPILTDADGHVVLGQIGGGPLYVLADPDLLSNIGMRDPAQARAALELLDWLNATGAKTITFDVTLNGFGASPSPLKLLFDPPFLAMTLTLAAAVLLAGVQATARFGPARRRARAIAFGKTALIDNAAALVRKAGRQGRLGPRYVDLVRERAGGVFGVPARLQGAAVDGYLDGLRGRARFSALAAEAQAARDPRAMLAAAQALHHWLWEKTR